MSTVCIIPARGGSKRIPRKNIRLFCGKPMISYSVCAARTSGLFSRVVVSTDDNEVARCAAEYGAEVPFMRPAHLADDHTPTLPVIRHAIAALAHEIDDEDAVCCLYPTAPLLRSADLAAALAALKGDPTVDFVFAAATFDFPIHRAMQCDAEGHAHLINPAHEFTRSQDLPSALHDAGQFYWARARTWMRAAGVFSSVCRPLMLPRSRVQDIDTPEDWEHAEVLFATLQRSGPAVPNGLNCSPLSSLAAT